MFDAFQKAFAQLPEPAFRGVLIKSLLLTAALYVALLVLAFVVVPPLIHFDWSWLEWLAEAAGLAVFLVAGFLLFPAVATLFVSLFLEEIAEAVERRFYPSDPAGKSTDAATAFALSLRFTVVLVLLNLLVLPIYLLGMIFPPLNVVVFYGLNGYLLSREYFELVSSRHLPPDGMRRLRRSEQGRLILTGIVIAFLLTVPIVNFVAPLLATAAMVHVFKDLRARHSV
jgi:CysZ protein